MNRRPEPIVCGFCDRPTDILVGSDSGTYRLRCLGCQREVVTARDTWPGPAAAARALGLTGAAPEPAPAPRHRTPANRRRVAR